MELWLLDTNNNPIISPTKMVPNFPLTHFMNFTSLPDGIFGVLSEEKDLRENPLIMGQPNLFLYHGVNGRISMAQENFIRRYLMKAGKNGA